MRPISDALELLTAQHEEIDDLLARLSIAASQATFDELADKLVAHLALEQDLLYPAITSTVSRDVLDEMLREHLAIKRVLADMVWGGLDDPWFGIKLADLTALLGGHCAWQEQELFETVAENLPANLLERLNGQLLAINTPLQIAA